jgi:uncharacterized protein (TIGR02757 family)
MAALRLRRRAPSSERARRLTPRETRIARALEDVRARCDVGARREADPVGFAHAFADAHDCELVALVGALVAFGNVKAIRAKMKDLLDRIGPHPAIAADDEPALRARLRTWRHRVFRGEDVARLLFGARAVQREHGSLGALFEVELSRGPDLRSALARWCDVVRQRGRLGRGTRRRGPAHLLPDPRGPSGSKRLLLFLRWMVRPADGIDLGMWRVPPSRLLVPVDVHIHKLSRNLGFTRRRDLSWRTTEEITGALARLDPDDPAKYDFSLCHMGMLQRCPSRHDPKRCEGCGVKPVCVHWSAPEPVRET